MPTISVIIPMYNACGTIARCLDSLLGQDFADFEVLVVDDGSQDDSLAICREYAARDSRVKVFHQENKGVSSARNLGLGQAGGDYIGFVDSDDYVTGEYFSLIASGAKENADLVILGYQRIDMPTGNILQTVSTAEGILNKNEFDSHFFDYWSKTGLAYVTTKAFRSSVIREHRLTFCPDLPYGEDMVFMLDFLVPCKKLYLAGGAAYCYIKGAGNNLTSKIDVNKKEHFRRLDEALIRYVEKCGVPATKDQVYGKFFTRYYLYIPRIVLDRTMPYRQVKAYLRDLLTYDYWRKIYPYIKPDTRSLKMIYWLMVHRRYRALVCFYRVRKHIKKWLGE